MLPVGAAESAGGASAQRSEWAATGSESANQGVTASGLGRLGKGKAPPERGFSLERLKGFEPSTFCMASRRSSQLSYSRTGGILAVAPCSAR